MANTLDKYISSGGNGSSAGAGGIDAVLLDAGNTLVYVDRRRMLEIFRETGGVEVGEERFREAEYEARLSLARAVEGALEPGRPAEAAAASGTEDHVWREYFLTLFRECGVPQSRIPAVGERIKEIHAHDHLWSHVEDDTAAVLDELRDLGYRLAVVSNADGRVERLLEDVGVRDRFEFVLDSHVVGIEKPDPRIFLAACERLGVEPARCLYVGDLYPVDVVGARAAGLRAVLLDPMGRLDHPVDRIRGLGELPTYLGAGQR